MCRYIVSSIHRFFAPGDLISSSEVILGLIQVTQQSIRALIKSLPLLFSESSWPAFLPLPRRSILVPQCLSSTVTPLISVSVASAKILLHIVIHKNIIGIFRPRRYSSTSFNGVQSHLDLMVGQQLVMISKSIIRVRRPGRRAKDERTFWDWHWLMDTWSSL